MISDKDSTDRLRDVRLYDRPSDFAKDSTAPDAGWIDLRSVDASATRDRSTHRRSTWLYDDLLN